MGERVFSEIQGQRFAHLFTDGLPNVVKCDESCIGPYERSSLANSSNDRAKVGNVFGYPATESPPNALNVRSMHVISVAGASQDFWFDLCAQSAT